MRFGDYEALDELGHGGFATVHRVRSPRGEILALKLLKGNLKADVYRRFEREKELLASLGEAEGFVPLLASGVCDRGPFFVMPLLTGGTLRDLLRRRGQLGIDEIWRLGRALAIAIGWAHSRGIIHRDLKPENVLFDGRGRPLISDLGIAKQLVELSSTSAEALTQAGVFLGTLGYMSPEQVNCASNVTASSDVFSLGVILYECLAGKSPFEAHSVGERLVRALDARHTPITELRPDVPLPLANAIWVALLRDPAQRHADGFAFAHALGAHIPQMAAISTTADERPEKPRPRIARRIGRKLSIVFAGLTASAIGAVVFRGGMASPPRAPQPPVVAPPPPLAPVAKGWFEEPMPPGLRKGSERPVYLFDTGRGFEIELVHVPAGDFMMGAVNGSPQEKPIHTHSMPRAYYIGRTEVTRREYLTFCKATGRPEPLRPEWPLSEEHPMVVVNWGDARAFCDWAHVVLPSEAEWEKAARGSTDWRQWPWGDEWLPERANIFDASCPDPERPDTKKETTSDGFPYTAPVGSFPKGASPYGALDMAGNAMEWCADWFDPGIYQEYSNGRTEPPASGTKRVMRGGDWESSRYVATVTFRGASPPETTAWWLGFRVALRSGAPSVGHVR